MQETVNYKINKSFKLILIMGLLTAIGPLSIDMYLPSFPDIAKSMHTTVSQVTFSLSSFFIGICIGQLVYGPLLERYGRKRPLYAGLVIYILSSVGCIFAQSVNLLVVLRFFQAVGGCVGLVAARAMVRDLFSVEDNAKVFSLLMLVVGVSPIIAPTLGGYITFSLGWQYIFIILSAIVLLLLISSYLYLPESKQPDPNVSLKPSFIMKNFSDVLKHPHFRTYALTGAISYAGLYAYIGGAPYVFMEIYKVTERQFGLLFSLIAVGIIGSSQLNTLLLKKFSSEHITKVASFVQSLTALTILILVSSGWINLFLTVFLIFIFLCCQGFIFPNSTALALAPMGNNAGNASALIGAIQMTIGATASALISILQNQTEMPMAVLMFICATLAFGVFLVGRKALVQSKNFDEKEEALETISTF